MENGLFILLIDDSKVIVNRLLPLIEEVPNVEKVFVGNSYEEGEDLLKQNNFDVAVLDINLPNDKSGIDLLKLIKRNSTSTRVIMMTGDPSNEKKKLCLTLGADHFLSKFDDFEMIPEAIEGFGSYNNT